METKKEKPSVYRLEMTAEQRKALKINATLAGLSIKEYILNNTIRKTQNA